MNATVEARIEAGAAWLDVHYPNWWQVIDLGTLELADCSLCVLGQVYEGCIPAGEKNQLIAQVAQAAYPSHATLRWQAVWSAENGETGGYNLLRDHHDLDFTDVFNFGFSAGFVASWEEDRARYEELTEEWTRYILTRRLDAHPDVRELTVKLDQLRELV